MDTKAATAATINPTIVDAKGDLIAATAADTVSRLAVGANNTVLTADSTAATGMKWAATSGSAAFVGCIAFGAVNLSFGTTNTAVSDLGTELVDTDGFHTGTQSRMTIPSGKDGKYRMELNITFAATDPTLRILAYKNGAAITEGLVNGSLMALSYTAAALSGFSVGLIVTGVATDYFEFFIVNGSASKLVDKARYSFTYLGA
jgi:phage-related tail fiber protein